MRRIFLAVLVFVLMTTNVQAGSRLNGKDWRRLAPRERLYFIAGLNEGMIFTASLTELATRKKDIRAIIERNAPMDIAYDSQCKELDKFYMETRNLGIPVILALKVVKMQRDGEGKNVVEEMKIKLRGDYPQ